MKKEKKRKKVRIHYTIPQKIETTYMMKRNLIVTRISIRFRLLIEEIYI